MCLLPGLLIAGGGLCIFAFAENLKNYKYTHSAWHMLMATCTIFLLPPRPKKKGMSILFSYLEYKTIQLNVFPLYETRGHRCRDRMVAGFITTNAFSAYHH